MSMNKPRGRQTRIFYRSPSLSRRNEVIPTTQTDSLIVITKDILEQHSANEVPADSKSGSVKSEDIQEVDTLFKSIDLIETGTSSDPLKNVKPPFEIEKKELLEQEPDCEPDLKLENPDKTEIAKNKEPSVKSLSHEPKPNRIEVGQTKTNSDREQGLDEHAKCEMVESKVEAMPCLDPLFELAKKLSPSLQVGVNRKVPVQQSLNVSSHSTAKKVDTPQGVHFLDPNTIQTHVGKYVRIDTELEQTYKGLIYSVDPIFKSIMLGNRSHSGAPLNVQVVSGFGIKSICSIEGDPGSSFISLQEMKEAMEDLAKNKIESQQKKEISDASRNRNVGTAQRRTNNSNSKRGPGQGHGQFKGRR